MIATERGMIASAKKSSARTAARNKIAADNRLYRISGEVVTAAEAMAKLGMPLKRFRARYMAGYRTWEALR